MELFQIAIPDCEPPKCRVSLNHFLLGMRLSALKSNYERYVQEPRSNNDIRTRMLRTIKHILEDLQYDSSNFMISELHIISSELLTTACILTFGPQACNAKAHLDNLDHIFSEYTLSSLTL
jgi:hypothetical protein